MVGFRHRLAQWGLVAAAPFVALACGESTHRGTGGTGGTSGSGAGHGGSGNASHGGAGSAGHAPIGGEGGEGGETTMQTGGAGAGGTFACSTDWTAAVGLAFDVVLKETDAEHRAEYRDFVFAFETAEHGVDVVVGSPGQAFRRSLSVQDGALVLGSELRISDAGPNEPGSPSHNGIFLEELSLCVTAPTGARATLEGAGRLRVVADGDDYDRRWESTFTLHGALDETRPAWTHLEPLDPLNPETLTLSEPLELGAMGSLDDGGGPITLVPATAAGTVTGFDMPVVLPLGFRGAVTSTSRDLAGNRVDAEDFTLETPADPGLQAQDGFESELHASSITAPRVPASPNDAILVSGGQALAGTQSVLIDAGSIVFFRLKRPPASSGHVRLLVKPLVDAADRKGSIVVRAGAPTEAGVVSQEIPVELLEGDLGMGGASGTGNAGGAGGAGAGCDCDGVTEVDLVVPGESDEIVVSIETPFIELSASSIARAIIDDLRVD